MNNAAFRLQVRERARMPPLLAWRVLLFMAEEPMREEPSRKHIMTTRVTWYGTQEESFDLVNAVARNCACEFGLMGVRLTTCAPHQMLVEDQRALNGLLFARSIADRLKAEEWSWG